MRQIEFSDGYESSVAPIPGSISADFTMYQESLGLADGVAVSFGPLSFTPIEEKAIMVFVNGVIVEDSLWALSGSDILFGTAPADASSVYVAYITEGTPTPTVPSGTLQVEYRTISGAEATAKNLTLIATPLSAANVMVDMIQGSSQEYSVDFTVTGTTLSWSGLGLDLVVGLVAGDKLRIQYLSA